MIIPGSGVPAVMRAAFLLAPGEVEVREVPVPRPGRGEVLVGVEAALTCGTDLKMYRRGHARLPLPAPFGHEFAGRVVVTGEGVREFTPGDAVMCVPTAPCGACRLCEAGRENLCPQAVGRMVLGAYADYVLLPEHIVERHLFQRPPSLTPEAAAMLEPLACVVHGASRVAWPRVRHAVILGDGAIALLFARMAVLRNVPRVLVLGRHETRLVVARQYGAEAAIASDDDAARDLVGEFTTGAGADLVVECVGTPETWRLASELACTGGVALLFGGCAASARVDFDAGRLHYDEIDLIGAFHYTPRAVQQAVALLADGTVDASPLITHRVPLERLDDALALMNDRSAIRVALTP
ncbi:alcohol dehydrogenase catalytic domain-containing protein [soil metagenome]